MKKDYYLFTSGELSRKDYNLLLLDKDGKKHIIPIETVDNIFCYTSFNINTDLLHYLGDCDINVHFFDYYNNYKGSFTGKGLLHSGNTHVKQALHYIDNGKRLYLAKQFISSAMWSIHKNMLEYDIDSEYDKYKEMLDSCNDVNSIMGIEGSFRKKYYENFDNMIKFLKFEKRTKQPPLNELNALISFGNSLCYSYCLNAIKQTYLNSTISFLHECGDRRHSLCLDLAEIFKPIIIDRSIFKLVNKRSLTSEHFEKTDTFCYLNEKGKKIFVKEIEDKLNTTFFYRNVGRNISYKRKTDPFNNDHNGIEIT